MLYNSSRAYVFLFIIVLNISDNIRTGDKATNTDPGPGYSDNFSFCHCSLNSIAVLTVTSYYGIYQDYNNAKVFADDTFLFSENCDAETANILNNDLRKIREWAEQWKMVF